MITKDHTLVKYVHVIDFQSNQNGLNDPKGNKKYNLHYGEVQEDVLRASHDT